MGRKPLEKVSQREYARRLNISNEAVRKAVELGKITKGWDKKEKKIIVEKANEEWGNIHIKAQADEDQTQAEAIKRLQSYDGNKPAPAPSLVKSKRPEDPDDTQGGAFAELEEYELAVASRASFAEALRVEKVAKARSAIIDLRKQTGELVNKAEVYKQLFGYGQQIRTAILAVPDRCIDEILTAPNRAESHQVLTKYLHEALQKLSDIENINFQNKENE